MTTAFEARRRKSGRRKEHVDPAVVLGEEADLDRLLEGMAAGSGGEVARARRQRIAQAGSVDHLIDGMAAESRPAEARVKAAWAAEDAEMDGYIEAFDARAGR